LYESNAPNLLQIDEGIQFYEAMLITLDKAYDIGLDTFFDVLEPRSKDKMVRCVLVSAQKCLLCLGDLARYKEQVQVQCDQIGKKIAIWRNILQKYLNSTL
jgi:hypothetical protein